MALTEISEPPGPILSSRARRHLLVLPEDPTDEELVRYWTLSEADKHEVLRCRGEDNRRRFALLRIPRESCHPFHMKLATDSTQNLPLIPRKTCH
jgi:Domain of unknown function (DUF4158)